MSKITALVADDHKIVRIGLVSLLKTDKDIRVVGEADDGDSAIALAAKHKPDIVILDLMMPKTDGVAATSQIKASSPATKILILTSFSTTDRILQALEAGANGAIMKTADDADILSAVKRVIRGERYISADIRRQIAIDPPAESLTLRQKDVLQALSNGYTNKDIAKQLGIGEPRVEEIVHDVLRKLNAANRSEAVAIAFRKHLLKA